jgi:hypothetical protein
MPELTEYDEACVKINRGQVQSYCSSIGGDTNIAIKAIDRAHRNVESYGFFNNFGFQPRKMMSGGDSSVEEGSVLLFRAA